jgi:hypothetical protein
MQTGRRDSNGQKFLISKTSIWEFRRGHPRKTFFKYSLLDDEPFKAISYAKSLQFQRHPKIKVANIRKKFPELRQLATQKYDTLLHKQSSRDFYRDLPSELDSDSNSDSASDSSSEDPNCDDLKPFFAQFDRFLPQRFSDFQAVHSSPHDQRKINADRLRLLKRTNEVDENLEQKSAQPWVPPKSAQSIFLSPFQGKMHKALFYSE